MSRLVRAAAVRTRRDHRGAGGFALVVVLGAIFVFSVVVIALLSLTLTDMKVQAMSGSARARIRAVDGALDVAVNEIKTSVDGTLGRIGSCDPNVPIVVAEVESTPVEVFCTPLPGPRSDFLPTTTGAAVLLLGNYTAPVEDALAATRKAQANAGMLSTTVAQISTLVLEAQSYLAANGPGLISTGPQPLTVDGDLLVRTSTLAQRLPTPVSPALRINGVFHQGKLGLFGGVGFWLGSLWIGTPSCGVMDPSFPVDYGARVEATLGRKCGIGQSASEFADPTGPIATWTAATIAANARTLAVDGAGCPATRTAAGVVTVAAGSYNFAESAKLQKWFTVCEGLTFWFPGGGDYFFDYGGGAGSARGALTFGKGSNRWVFGQPLGWDPATQAVPDSAFPTACDPNADGVTLTLSSRTTIQHTAGLAALCGRTDAATGLRKLVYQQPLGSEVTWAAVPALPATGGVGKSTNCSTNASGSNPGFGGFVDADRAVAASGAAPAGFPALGAPWNGSEVSPLFATATCLTNTENQPALRLGGFTSAFGGPLKSLKLRVRGTTSNLTFNPNTLLDRPEYSKMRATLTTADGTGTCSLPALPGSGDVWRFPTSSDTEKTYTFDLTACPTLGDGSQLEGATLSLTPKLMRATGNSTPASMSVDTAWLEVVTGNSTVSSAFTTLHDTSRQRAVWFFGPVHLPSSAVNVNWQGSASVLPIFSGGLVAQGLASYHLDDGVTVGTLASPSVLQASRKVLLRAKVGDQLRGSAIVTLDDASDSGTTASAGNKLSVDDWRLCSQPFPTDGTERPCPAPD